MAKITIPNILGMFLSVTGINTRFNQVEEEFNDKVLYRDNPGTEPNQMENDLDMNSNDIINVRSITFITGNSLVQGIESGSPNIIVEDDGEGNYTISGVSLGGGDVFTAFSNEYLPGTIQKMPKLEVLGVDIGEEIIAQAVIQAALVSDVEALEIAVASAVNSAGIALTAANAAQATAAAAQGTANSAETKANQNALTLSNLTDVSSSSGTVASFPIRNAAGSQTSTATLYITKVITGNVMEVTGFINTPADNYVRLDINLNTIFGQSFSNNDYCLNVCAGHVSGANNADSSGTERDSNQRTSSAFKVQAANDDQDFNIASLSFCAKGTI